MDRARCFDVPKHHGNLWRDYTRETENAALVGERGDERAAGFSSAFLPELYHRLYAETPREVPTEERSRAAAVRAKLHDLASELPEFETLRKQTVRDPMWAGMAACALGENVARTLPEARSTPDADKARQLLEGLESLAGESTEAAAALAAHLEKAQAAADAAESAVEGQASGLDESALRNALRAGIDAAAEAIDEAQAAMTALGWGSGTETSSAARSPGVAVELAKRVRSSAKLKKIVELAGRLTMTARQKRAARTEYARSEVAGVEQTGEIARLLPSELVSLADPALETTLYRRLHERAALGYKVTGKERSAKGPIVICIDQSGSMDQLGRDEWAKAVALALLDAARAERRAFGIILYNGYVAEARLFPVAQDADPRVLLDLLSRCPSGGTEYAPALRQALDWIASAGKFNRADVVHITDGEASIAAAELTRARAKELGAHIFGIGLGYSGAALAAWSDDVTRIDDIGKDSAAVDLVFDAI